MLDWIYYILLVLYVPACLGLIVLVLLQKGKGTGFAGAFGVGAGSETVFGPRASRSLPVRLTYIFAATFMTIALLMSIISGGVGKGQAPALAEQVGEVTGTPTGSSELTDLGIGTGEAGSADGTEETPAEPTTEEALSVEEAAADTAAAGTPEAVSGATTAPSSLDPTAESPSAATPPTPEEQGPGEPPSGDAQSSEPAPTEPSSEPEAPTADGTGQPTPRSESPTP